METLVLARHALAGSNGARAASGTAPGEGLLPDGVEQARQLGEALASEDVGLGVATGFRRTQETLALALEGRSVPILRLPELNEIGFGQFDGGPLDTYRAWAAAEQPTTPAPGGGESRAQAAARYARGLRLLLERDERVILVIGHALCVRYVLDAAAGLVPAARIAPVEHAVPYRLGMCEARDAAALLEEWSVDPRFRDPSDGGRARPSRGRPLGP
jgi:broad specificity phosphatase PhoE